MQVKKNKILFVQFLPNGGSSVALLNWVNFLSTNFPNKYDLVIATVDGSIFISNENNPKYKLYIKKGEVMDLGQVFQKPLLVISNYFSVLFFLLKIVIKERPSLIHTFDYMWSIYSNPVGFLTRTPGIIYVCNVYPLEPKVARILLKFNPRTTFITVSKYVYNLFTKKFKLNPAKTKFIYDGVDTDKFKPLSLRLIKQKSISKEKIISYVSRIWVDRDVEKFIEIAAIISQKYPLVKFVHVGYDPKSSDQAYFKNLQKLVKELNLGNRFIFKKYSKSQDAIPVVLRKSYLQIIPARSFALPNVAIQSMMCGTPVIAYNVGGNPEIIKNGINGSLVNVNSSVSYANEIEKYLLDKNDYVKKCIESIKYSTSVFDNKISYKKMLEVYKSILNI